MASEDRRPGVPWFGRGPAETPTQVTDILLDLDETVEYGFVDDEVWMDIIAEGKFDRSVARQKHGNRSGGRRNCQCFLCVKWRRNAKANQFTAERIRPLTDPKHPIFRKSD